MGWASQYIAALQQGKTISFRPHGSSMLPRIKSGQLCTVEPVTDASAIAIGDVVLCRVGGSQYLHLVTAREGDRVRISNNHGHHNGWCGPKAVYGRLVKVEP